jgi:hypothetical protein
MAVYKVPQDVEADDKLLGPFSFRQFIYLIIAVMAIAIAWLLGGLFIPLAVIPLPIVVFFGALALPLKKDQPMEIYLAAVLSFYLKPRKRLWQPDGIQSLVEIVAPRMVEEQRTKDLSQSEAEQRLSYLASLVDSRGWAVRGVSLPEAENAMQTDVYFEAQQTQDVLDEKSKVANAFENMIGQTEAERRQEALNRMHQPAAPAPPPPDPYIALTPPAAQATPADPWSSDTEPTISDVKVTFNPYPTSMHQAVINPLGSSPAQPVQPAQPPAAPQSTSAPIVSPDIINLANNSDLSIETIAHEAKRIHEKEEKSSEDEVVISLR